jgi:hypothetical protein
MKIARRGGFGSVVGAPILVDGALLGRDRRDRG